MSFIANPAAGVPAKATAADLLETYSDSEMFDTQGGQWRKLKEIRLARGGSYRIKFDKKVFSSSGNACLYKIYRNGAAVGTEWSTTSDTYTTQSEDISGWSSGDLCQLYLYRGVANTGYTRNFRLYSQERIDHEVIS